MQSKKKPTLRRRAPQPALPLRMPAPASAPAGKPVVLPALLVDAWRDALLALGKLPRGTDRGEPAEARLTLLLKQETKVVAELWETFTQERGELSRRLLSGRRETVAYLLGFHLANAARLQLALDRADERHGLSAWLRAHQGRIRFHDLGCGTGALSQTFAAFAQRAGFPSARLDVDLSDLSGSLLDAAREVLTRTGVQPRTHKTALEKLPVERFGHGGDAALATVYGLGYVWNELRRNAPARARIAKILAEHVERREDALLCVLEPANQDLCREAMALRDELVAGGWLPLYPCPAATACPMLERTRDWCYGEGLWKQPRPMALLDQRLGLDRARFSATMFVFATPSLALKLARRPGAGKPVVVGRPATAPAGVTPRAGKAYPGAFEYLQCLGDELKKCAAAPGKPFLLRGSLAND